VTHGIVQKCFDFTRLLHKLSAADETPPVLTLARGDETSIPAHAQEKDLLPRKVCREIYFIRGGFSDSLPGASATF